MQAASGPEVTILAHVPRPSVPSLAAAGLTALLITAGSANASTGGVVSSSGARWTVLVIAAVLIAAGGLAIVKSMWGMRAPLKRGATETTEGSAEEVALVKISTSTPRRAIPNAVCRT